MERVIIWKYLDEEEEGHVMNERLNGSVSGGMEDRDAECNMDGEEKLLIL